MIAENNSSLYFADMSEANRSEREGRNFKRDAARRLIYFPFGSTSAGRLVPLAREESARAAAFVANMGTWLLLIVGLAASNDALVDIGLVWTWVAPFLAGSGMELTKERMAADEVYLSASLREVLVEVLLAVVVVTLFSAQLSGKTGPAIATVVAMAMLIGLAVLFWRPLWLRFAPAVAG